MVKKQILRFPGDMSGSNRQKNGMDLIRSRRSVRSFDGKPLSEEEQESLLSFASSVETPYDLPITWRILDAKTHGLSSPVVTGTDLYMAGKMARSPHAEEAFGFAFERVVLFAVESGIGTTWIAGTMNRDAFERAMRLDANEVMPCVSPLGHPAAKMSLRERMMRKGVKADTRLPFEELFFDSGFDTPLTAERAGELADVLEMVRWAPSAVNKQPWRAVICGDLVHFYEKQSRGFVDASGWDLQKVDLGIAMCHFVYGMEEKNHRLEFLLTDPGLPHLSDTVYIASFRIQ